MLELLGFGNKRGFVIKVEDCVLAGMVFNEIASYFSTKKCRIRHGYNTYAKIYVTSTLTKSQFEERIRRKFDYAAIIREVEPFIYEMKKES